MTEILMLLTFNVAYILGFYLAIQPGMVGDFITTYGQRMGKLFDPIGGCITCMASLHSWPYIAAFGIDWIYPVYVFALASLNTIAYNKLLHDDLI